MNKLNLYNERQNNIKENINEVELLKKRLKEAENLLHDLKITGSHYQINEMVNKFFNKK